ncbi:hypothetical protein TNIN_264651 [Trichonephila inaurata madagascariensis]|uniref:Uncharacterized protein n=1 Tax=Trichonephila inaurata madagascariensis TaxID=2747483 RepID=A0A8X7CMI4_9ARAC|nr:hypothetical protein TNIN_264651 [Trichonephila inaurata madagascariensis]
MNVHQNCIEASPQLQVNEIKAGLEEIGFTPEKSNPTWPGRKNQTRFSRATRISSGKQDSANGVRKSPYFSCVRPRLSNDRNFPSSSSYKAGKSVFFLPETAFFTTKLKSSRT